MPAPSAAASSELLKTAERLKVAAAYIDDESMLKPLKALETAASAIGRASSDSWFGYHATVYYADFQKPPAGAHFSPEWGLMNTFSRGSQGDWREYSVEEVDAEIERRSGQADLGPIEKAADKVKEELEDAQARVVSILSDACRRDAADTYLADLLTRAKELKVLRKVDILRHWSPKGQLMSRDTTALMAGITSPPHMVALARVLAAQQPATACRDLAKVASRTASHLSGSASVAREAPHGTHVFVGHGRSALWKDLRDFVRDRLHLPFDEFNRVPVAGVTNIARLSQMLDSAAIAFLIMTAEDEQADGTKHARTNVVHEAGLFQGRLGFERAIVLLEEGCEEFSNIHGLGQIRFPKGNIAAAFEEIRAVLEREGVLE